MTNYLYFKPVCEAAVKTQDDLRQRLEVLKIEIEDLLNKRIPFVLRRFTPKAVRYEPIHHTMVNTPTEVNFHLPPSQQIKKIRKRRFVSELIGLGIQGISAYLEYRKTSSFEKGLKQLLRHNTLQDHEIRAIKKDMLSLTRATVKDLTQLRQDISQHAEIINQLTKQTDEFATLLQHHER